MTGLYIHFCKLQVKDTQKIEQKLWRRCDDAEITLISESKVLANKATAYILVYARI